VTSPPDDDTGQSDLDPATAYFAAMISALNHRFDVQHADLKESIRERLAAMNDLRAADDLRYEQRFQAQTKALDAALAAAKEAVQTAMVAAEKATTKAESAAEKRFEAVNEFRAQLADQAATFIPRVESEARVSAIVELFDSKYTALIDRMDVLTQANAASQGRSAGLGAGWNYLVGLIGLIVAVLTIVGIIIGTRS
jgi:hypothetical protein